MRFGAKGFGSRITLRRLEATIARCERRGIDRPDRRRRGRRLRRRSPRRSHRFAPTVAYDELMVPSSMGPIKVQVQWAARGGNAALYLLDGLRARDDRNAWSFETNALQQFGERQRHPGHAGRRSVELLHRLVLAE